MTDTVKVLKNGEILTYGGEKFEIWHGKVTAVAPGAIQVDCFAPPVEKKIRKPFETQPQAALWYTLYKNVKAPIVGDEVQVRVRPRTQSIEHLEIIGEPAEARPKPSKRPAKKADAPAKPVKKVKVAA